MSARKTCITVASAGALALAVPAIKQYEGYAPTVVPDKLAGGLPTGGYGETVGVKLGETHSEKFWSDRLAKRLVEDYDAGIGKCITVELPDGVRAMALSIAWNAGPQAVCSSPMVKAWNAGDIEGGCRALLTKNAEGQYIGWRIASRPQGPGTPLVVQPGLINRRADERKKCLAAAREPAPLVAAAPVPFPPHVVAPPATPAAPVVETLKPSWWRSLLARLRCWIFKCEAAK
jgi:lysozyme